MKKNRSKNKHAPGEIIECNLCGSTMAATMERDGLTFICGGCPNRIKKEKREDGTYTSNIHK